MKTNISNSAKNRQGFTLTELLVAMALGLTVMSGVLGVLVTSKNNFISERELAALQENARYAIKFMSDEIRMAGFNGCSGSPLSIANSVNGSSSSWYLNGTGIEGYEHEAGINSFPVEFRSDVTSNTDAIVIRRAMSLGLSIAGNHNPNSTNIPLNKQHVIKPGTIMVIASPDCQQVGIFQVSGPSNNNNNAQHLVHNTGAFTPGNCTNIIGGNFDCNNVGNAVITSYPEGSQIMKMSSQAFYIGQSSIGNGIPALYREVLGLTGVNATTVSEELVQGVEEMQFLYGLDNALNDNMADIYLKANDGAMNWSNVVSVRLSLRMRSNYPIYSSNETYSAFQGIAGTNGSDRYMRQLITTTIQLRN